jgi:hypothetical protein
LDRRFRHTSVRLALGLVELFATALLDADYVPDMIQVILRLDESIQHIDEDRSLLLSCARAGLPVIRVVNAKAVFERGVNMVLKNARQVDRVFFEVVKGSDCIEKGAVIHLSAKLDRITVGVDIALPNVLKYIVRLD